MNFPSLSKVFDRGRLLLIATALSLSCPALAAENHLTLAFGATHLRVELALDQDSRERGLMYRQQLGANQGMLFRFEQAETHCMWMKNTFIPLTVAFLDERGVITDLLDLAPHNLQPRCSSPGARFAVEARQGWFARHGVGVGARVLGLDAL